MKTNSKILLSLLIFCCFLTANGQTPPQQNSETVDTPEIVALKQRVGSALYRIEANQCFEGKRRVATGFLSNDHQALITSLHGIVGCEDILAQNDKGDTLYGLTISYIDFDRDIAVLTSEEVVQHFRENASVGISASPSYLGQIVSLGFPLTRTQLTDELIRLRLGDDGSITSSLNGLLPEADQAAFRLCASPKTDIQVYDLGGSLRPGESGAPLLNQDAEVIGIVAGGIPSQQLSWAIPINHLQLVPAEDIRRVLALRAEADCVTNRFAEVPEDSQQPSIRELEERMRVIENYLYLNPGFLESLGMITLAERERAREALREVAANLVRENDETLQQAITALQEGREEEFEALFEIYAERTRQLTIENIQAREAKEAAGREYSRRMYDIAVIRLYTQPLQALADLELALEADARNLQALNELGLLQNRLGRNHDAMQTFEQALAIAQQIGDRAGEGTSLNNIGLIYRVTGDYPQALNYYERALAIAQEISDRAGEGRILNNIGFIYDSTGDYPQALNYYERALKIMESIGSPDQVVIRRNIDFLRSQME